MTLTKKAIVEKATKYDKNVHVDILPTSYIHAFCSTVLMNAGSIPDPTKENIEKVLLVTAVTMLGHMTARGPGETETEGREMRLDLGQVITDY